MSFEFTSILEISYLHSGQPISKVACDAAGAISAVVSVLLLGEQHARQLDPSAKIVMVELPTRAVGDVSARAGRCVCAVQEGAICKRAGAMPTWCPSRPRNSRNGTIHTRRRRRQRKFGCCRQFLNFRNELLNLHDFTSRFRNELLTPQRAISNAPNFTVSCNCHVLA